MGGAFNPPHIGHLVLAQEGAAQLGLGEVLLMPAGEAPHKRIDPEPGREVRMRMTELASEGDPVLAASRLEVERGGPSYTHDTLEALAAERPGDELWFLLGADVAAGLASWRDPGRVVALARLGIAARAGTPLADVRAALDELGARERAEVIEMPEIGVSSSDVRRRVAERRPIRHLVPEPVAALISEQGLYR